jgi:multisubunit Na+/H+ antiporter MnhB subunit
MLFSLIILVIFFAGVPEIDFNLLIQQPLFDINFALSILRIFALVVVISAAAASVFIRRDFAAILTLGAMGLGVAVLIVLEPAPDVALVQIIVDLLAVVILVLALTRLPRSQRAQARKLTFKQSRPGLVRDILVSAGVGGIVAWIALIALSTRPRENIVTSFYEANAKLLTGAKDIVGAIVVDFRAFDTLIEITVFSIAGLGIFTLLLYASRWAGDQVSDEPIPAATTLNTTGIGGAVTSSFIHALAYFSLPFSIILALVHILYGHDQPGDGFTAGVIVGLVIAFWYVVFGYAEVKARLWWLRPNLLISSGILLALLSGTLAALINGDFLSNVDFGALLNIPLPRGIYLSTSLLFEAAIFLSVLGSISYVLSALGHPRLSDTRSVAEVKRLEQLGESSTAPPPRAKSSENSSFSRDPRGEQTG